MLQNKFAVSQVHKEWNVSFEDGVKVLILHLLRHFVDHVEKYKTQQTTETIEAKFNHCQTYKSLITQARLYVGVQHPKVVCYLV